MTRPGLAVLLTCHDREALTTSCLRALAAALAGIRPDLAPAAVRVVLCDDGCRDGTVAAARSVRGIDLEVVAGDGSLFWNRGMLAAWSRAVDLAPDADVLLLNDDVMLDGDALDRLLALRSGEGDGAIAIGAVRDPVDGRPTYGGFRRRPWPRRLRFDPVVPAERPQDCDTFHGNCVLVPASVRRRIGMLDPVWRHGFGDLDLGLRARAAGVRLILGAGTVGTCPRNPWQGTWRDPALPLAARWRSIRSFKGLPPGQWWRFCWRHGGGAGLLVWAWTYLKLLLGRAGPRT